MFKLEKLFTKMNLIKEYILPSEIFEDEINKVPSLFELVNKAKEEWQYARKFFGEVTEPELVDHAIHRIEAAERKYMYLLKLAEKEKIVEKNIANLYINNENNEYL